MRFKIQIETVNSDRNQYLNTGTENHSRFLFAAFRPFDLLERKEFSKVVSIWVELTDNIAEMDEMEQEQR